MPGRAGQLLRTPGAAGGLERQERRPGLPVVPVEDVDRLAVERDARQRGSRQERESGGVVRVVGAPVDVVVGAVEAVGVVHEAEPIAIRLPIDEVHGRLIADVTALARPLADRDADRLAPELARRAA